MAITHYDAKTGEPVVFTHPIDAIEQLKAGLVVAKAGDKPATKKEAPAPKPKVEEVKAEEPAPSTEEEAPEAKPSSRKAPRRRPAADAE